MTDDLSSPHRPVRLLARSQSSTFQISLTRVFPSCFRSSSLPFPWYICPQNVPQYVLAISPHHMPVPDQSSLGDLLEACATLVVPRMCSFLILSLRVTPHIHRNILISVTSIRLSCLDNAIEFNPCILVLDCIVFLHVWIDGKDPGAYVCARIQSSIVHCVYIRAKCFVI